MSTPKRTGGETNPGTAPSNPSKDDAKDDRLEIHGPPTPKGVDDFTFFRKDVEEWNGWESDQLVSIITSEEAGSEPVDGRGLLCWREDGTVSITVRKKSEGSDYSLPGDKATDKWKDHGPFSLDVLCREMAHLLKLSEPGLDYDNPAKVLPPQHGLLLITGATESGKSLVAQGLIEHYLKARERADKKRRLHLVTCEDPVEAQYNSGETRFEDRDYWPAKIDVRGVDYTPRTGGASPDVSTPPPTLPAGDSPGRQALKKAKTSLKQALRDALRQTPAVFYAGELRTRSDLKEALNFAATGHFIVGTAHAGSLPEAFEKLLTAARAKTPARRGQVIQRVLGIIHQRKLAATSGKAAIIPTLWRRTSVGVASMVSEGLSSIVPNNVEIPVTSGGLHNIAYVSSFGRLSFARRLLNPNDKAPHEVIIDENEKREIVKAAGLSDLQGM